MPRSAAQSRVEGVRAYRLTQPPAHDGRGLALDAFISAVGELAATDSSQGWLAAGYGLAARVLNSAAADLVWGAYPDALVTVGQCGSAQLTGGRLTGRWGSVIGAQYADWFLLAYDGARVLVPRTGVDVEVQTQPAALGGTGVGDVTVTDFAVDDRHSCAVDPVVAAAAAASVVVGSALGGWRRHVDQVRARLAISYGGDEITDDAAAQIARSASDLDASRLQIATAGFSGGTAPYAQAISRARSAADGLMASSRHALDASDPVTAAWRDVHAGCRLAATIM